MGERAVRPSGLPAMSDLLWRHITWCWAQSPTTRPTTRQVVQNMCLHIPSPQPRNEGHSPNTNIQGAEDGDLGNRDGGDQECERDIKCAEEVKEENELTRKIGLCTADAAWEDWTLILDICDTVSSKARAKEAVRALRHTFKYGEPAAQLAAGKLWGIMLRNSSEIFIKQTTSRKFLSTLEALLTSSRTAPFVRERVMDVLASAAYASGSDQDTGFRGLWRRLRLRDNLDTEDPGKGGLSGCATSPVQMRPSAVIAAVARYGRAESDEIFVVNSSS
ncbi:hypothetical protein R3P38DRAFT_879780 [Favolaschia claudopus]|uniref:VHS domain-containing protein n=1 Tax=Favolaschia claudopus TaxID=2862362 RepID=A0AAW0BSY6_9AGAR